MPHKYFKNTKSILCLNGDLPNAKFFNCNKTIVAADGAGDKLLQIDIKPSVIIGDLDSAQSNNYDDIEIIHLPDQNQTDFEKAMQYMAKQNLLPTIVCGVNGGYIDHILNNISIITQHESVFYAPPLIGYVIKGPSTFKSHFPLNTKISLFGMVKSKINSSGLKWELNNETLELPGYNSSSNRTASEQISIEVLEGTLLILVYLDHIEDLGAK